MNAPFSTSLRRVIALELKPDKPEAPKPAPALSAAQLAEYAGTFKGTTTWVKFI
jgi:hypothetical protein